MENQSSGSSGSCCSSSGKPVTAASTGGTPSGEGDWTPSDEQPIRITPPAVDAIKNAISQEGESGDGLRVSVVGGGCSGYQYSLDFEKEPRMDDTVLTFGEVSIFVDSISVGYLRGTTIDYVSGLNGTGFKFNNPNAKRTCGCGSSFS